MRVHVSADEVSEFASRWPCASFPDESITFEFADNGDLVDVVYGDGGEPWEERGADGAAVVALSQDAQAESIGERVAGN